MISIHKAGNLRFLRLILILAIVAGLNATAQNKAKKLKLKLKKVNLLGHSWGGLVAMFYAIKYPDNLSSLMLINSTLGSSGWRNASFVLMARRTSPEDSIAQANLV